MERTEPKSEAKPTQELNEARVAEAIAGLRKEAEYLKQRRHPQFMRLKQALDAARLRQYANAEIRRELALNQAKYTLLFTKRQIDSDYAAGREDAREKIYADLRRKKKDVRDALDRLQQHGQPISAENALFNDVRIPNKKREKRSFRGSYNFKLPEPEARQDLVFIYTFTEEADAYRR